MKILILVFVVALFLVLAVLLALYTIQEKLIFFPEKILPDYPFVFDEKFEEVNFQTEENVMINGLLFRADSAKGLILYFHGNAGSLNTWGEVAKDFLPLQYDLLIVDFRGYGKSTGEISSEKQLHDDAEFIYKKISEKYPEGNMIIYGRSLGSGIATKLAAEHNPRSLVLETPFYSLRNMVKIRIPVLPAYLVLKYKFENFVWLKQTKCPVYLIHGTKDEVVPYNSSVQLAELSGNIRLFTLEGGTHGNLSDFPEFHKVLKNIIQYLPTLTLVHPSPFGNPRQC